MISVRQCVLVAILTLSLAQPRAIAAQTGQQNSRRFAPGTCGPVDPTYVHLAEQTGGQPVFLQPSEVAVAGHLMRETTRNSSDALLYATSHLGGQTREYTVPIDTAAKRVTFSLSFDAPGTKMMLLRPSGTAVAPGDVGVESSDWTCGRIVSIGSPEKGEWRVQLSGTGNFWLRVIAQGDLYILSAEFVQLGGRIGHEGYFKIPGQPLAGREQTLRAAVSGALRTADFRLVSAAGDTLQPVAMKQEGSDPEDHEFFGTLTLPDQPFRLAVNGLDKEGLPFQRVFLVQFRATTVAIDPINKFKDLHAGTSSTLRFLVHNLGETAKFHLLAVNSRGSIIPTDPADVEIAAGSSVEVRVDMTVPRETAPGTGVTVTITVASTSDPDIHNGTSVELSIVDP
jgi:von Willebrand factor A domain-containing protein 7